LYTIISIAGERCYDEGMFEAAKILFININNNAKLALCYVNLEQYREAVEAATKANSVSTWKEVCLACLKANEIRLANICGLHIIVHPDHLEDLIGHYERAGKSVELMQLLEQVQLTFDVIITTVYCLHCYYTCMLSFFSNRATNLHA
jgi:clathrin heavy chain